MSDPAPAREDRPAPNPRAFCQATGYIFLCVGGLLLVSSCCWGLIDVFVEQPIKPKDPQREVVKVLVDSESYQLWSMAALCVTIVAGLAATAVGISMQHERPKSARLGMVLSGALTLFFASYLFYSVINPALGRIAVAGVMALTWAMLFLLAGHSAEQLKRFPPSAEAPWTARDEDDLRRAEAPRPPDRTTP